MRDPSGFTVKRPLLLGQDEAAPDVLGGVAKKEILLVDPGSLARREARDVGLRVRQRSIEPARHEPLIEGLDGWNQVFRIGSKLIALCHGNCNVSHGGARPAPGDRAPAATVRHRVEVRPSFRYCGEDCGGSWPEVSGQVIVERE